MVLLSASICEANYKIERVIQISTEHTELGYVRLCPSAKHTNMVFVSTTGKEILKQKQQNNSLIEETYGFDKNIMKLAIRVCLFAYLFIFLYIALSCVVGMK